MATLPRPNREHGPWGSQYPTGASKRYAAFISYAEPDRQLALALHALLRELGVEAYVASVQLPDTGTSAWKEEIIKAIHDSECFIPIYTRHSLARPWVLFELGVASSAGIMLFPARVKSLRSRELLLAVPGQHALVYDLWKTDSLRSLVFNVLKRARRQSQVDPAHHTAFEKTEHAQKIMTFATERWVFIAGNLPKDAKDLERVTIEGAPGLSGPEKLARIAGDITQSLFKHGFNVSSCPEVEPVGGKVAEVATRFMATSHEDLTDRYRIGGIYPVDRDKRRSSLPDIELRMWRKLFEGFRSSYLLNHEWLIVLGGNDGTLEEVEAARSLKVKVLTIAALGGTGRAIASTPGVASPLDAHAFTWNATTLAQVIEALSS